MESKPKTYFTAFKGNIDGVSAPSEFTFPFYYTPHSLSKLAAKELQEDILEKHNWNHNFGLDPEKKTMPIGKMFGVLVVKDEDGGLGYLSAFSGELQESNPPDVFVPTVNNKFREKEFTQIAKEKVEDLNSRQQRLEESNTYINLKYELSEINFQSKEELLSYKEQMKEAKAIRKQKRKNATEEEKEKLIKESLHYKHQYRQLKASWDERKENIGSKLTPIKNEIEEIKNQRKNILKTLQSDILDNYQFLNACGNQKSLIDIFNEEANYKPTSGTGDCAAPKLLQYAYLNNLTPIAMAEFWWGAPHKSEIRKHRNFYPACSSRCKPLMAHMLKGLNLEPNPMLENYAKDKEVEILFEDDNLAVINKPSGLLSVPGKYIKDSVSERMKQIFPEAEGPLIVHRLDQETSGIMLIAKNWKSHKVLQKQFIHRSIQKSYIAILDGIVENDQGLIDLPLRGDPDNRPAQLVCFEFGKPAKTEYTVIERKNDKTVIRFKPITGRTHQLRMHSAHNQGLGFPIVGDDIYGTKANRLHLHACWISFTHPISKEIITFECEPDFLR